MKRLYLLTHMYTGYYWSEDDRMIATRTQTKRPPSRGPFAFRTD